MSQHVAAVQTKDRLHTRSVQGAAESTSGLLSTPFHLPLRGTYYIHAYQ